MESFTAHPLRLVDVDGVVSLFGSTHLPPAGVLPTSLDGLPSQLSEQADPLLVRLESWAQRL